MNLQLPSGCVFSEMSVAEQPVATSTIVRRGAILGALAFAVVGASLCAVGYYFQDCKTYDVWSHVLSGMVTGGLVGAIAGAVGGRVLKRIR
jgi:hypothetical protein